MMVFREGLYFRFSVHISGVFTHIPVHKPKTLKDSKSLRNTLKSNYDKHTIQCVCFPSFLPLLCVFFFTAITAACAKASLSKSNTLLNTSDGSSTPTWGKQSKLLSWTAKTLDNLALRRLPMPTFCHSFSALRFPKRMLLCLCMHCACCPPALALFFCLKKSWFSCKAPSNVTFPKKLAHSLLAKYLFFYFL